MARGRSSITAASASRAEASSRRRVPLARPASRALFSFSSRRLTRILDLYLFGFEHEPSVACRIFSTDILMHGSLYIINLNRKLKVLDFIKSGGPSVPESF